MAPMPGKLRLKCAIKNCVCCDSFNPTIRKREKRMVKRRERQNWKKEI